jgi:hypothetical protein
MEVKINDLYEDVKTKFITEFDTSDYSKDNVYNMPLVNKKVLGKFKEELNGQIMSEFIGLRSKMYSYKMHKSEKECKKAKGIKNNVVKKEICFEDYRNCLLNNEIIYKTQNLFRTNHHNVYTIEQNKLALSAYDNKRLILEDGINTLAWGNHKIKLERNKFLNKLKEISVHSHQPA